MAAVYFLSSVNVRIDNSWPSHRSESQFARLVDQMFDTGAFAIVNGLLWSGASCGPVKRVRSLSGYAFRPVSTFV